MKQYLLSAVDRTQSFTGGLSTVDLTGEEADTFFDALASETTRELLEALYAAPATPSELAEISDTSLQNVHYHLEKLEAADLIEPVDMVYSSRGREVTVYGPTHRAIVLVAGESSMVGDIKSAVARFVGVVAVLALGALLVQSLLAGGLLGDVLAPGSPVSGDDAPAGPTPTGEADVVLSGGNVSGGDGSDSSSGETDGPTELRSVDSGTALTPTGTATSGGASTPADSEDLSPTPTQAGNVTRTPSPTLTPTPTPTANATATPTPTATAG